jgi:hypothetical protein
VGGLQQIAKILKPPVDRIAQIVETLVLGIAFRHLAHATLSFARATER